MAGRRPVTGRTRSLVLFLDRRILWLSEHWLALFNTLAGLYAGLPVLAPVLAALGLFTPARLIYFVYRYLCHQRPERSFFIAGHQVAFCERDTALYVAVFLAGVAYALSGRRWRPLSAWGVGALLLPLVVDGTLQLFFPYESTWSVRVVTGVLAGGGAVWFLYPRLALAFAQVNWDVKRQLGRARLRDQDAS